MFKKLAILAVVAFASVTAVQRAAETTIIELQAVMPDGQIFIAGAGDNCADAFKGAVIPDGWRELRCTAFRGPVSLN